MPAYDVKLSPIVPGTKAFVGRIRFEKPVDNPRIFSNPVKSELIRTTEVSLRIRLSKMALSKLKKRTDRAGSLVFSRYTVWVGKDESAATPRSRIASAPGRLLSV